MTKEFEELVSKYAKRVGLYLNENKFYEKKAQVYGFWAAYIKFCLDTHYATLTSEVFKQLVRDKILIFDNNVYRKRWHHHEYKKERTEQLSKLQWK
mgnify:CR=1 FL=1|tara:strand:+ start:959 stop:1246 length:288 start_codon:yes stop_codon:yes gene_type:complete